MSVTITHKVEAWLKERFPPEAVDAAIDEHEFELIEEVEKNE